MSENTIDKNTLIKISKLIDDLENNGFSKEADILHNEFLKLAQDEDEEELPQNNADVSKNVSTGIGLLGGLKNITKGLTKTKPGAFLGFGIADLLLNKGVDFAVDFFEDAQGPYQLFKNHLPDVEKIINKIKSLVNNSEINSLASQLISDLNSCQNDLEDAKNQIRTACNINFKVVYNNKTASTKLAIRGEFESEAPKYLRDLIQGGAVGAGVGAFAGGIGALPGALMGAIGKMGGRAIEDIWYATISDTGKAYLQGKDLEEKVTRLANSIEEINPDKTQDLKTTVEAILSKLEDLNVKNPNKSYLENVIRHFEKKTEKVTKPIVDVAKGAAGLVKDTGGGLVKTKDDLLSSLPSKREYFI